MSKHLCIQDSVDGRGGKVAVLTNDGRAVGFLCSVPNDFLEETRAIWRGDEVPAGEAVEKLEAFADNAAPSHGRYWPRPGEAVDAAFVANRIAGHIRNRLQADR